MNLQEALIDLYISLKSKATSEIKASKQDNDKGSLQSKNPLTILEYIKSYIDIAISVQVQNALKSVEQKEEESESLQNLEQLTQSLEAEVRLHIRVFY